MLDPLDLQEIWTTRLGFLGTELGSSAKVVCALNCCANSPAPQGMTPAL